jgi:transcriptional regulator with XRE-family HTH domain
MSTQSERLKQLRTTLGLTTTALAQAVGYTQGTISQLENSPEKTLEKRLIRALHLAFGVNEEWLRSESAGMPLSSIPNRKCPTRLWQTSCETACRSSPILTETFLLT